MLHEVAILEQIDAKLPARARQIVQRVEVELSGKLLDYTALAAALACIRARSLVLAEVSGSRIAAQSSAKAVDVGIVPLFYHRRPLLALCCWGERVVDRLHVPNEVGGAGGKGRGRGRFIVQIYEDHHGCGEPQHQVATSKPVVAWCGEEDVVVQR